MEHPTGARRSNPAAHNPHAGPLSDTRTEQVRHFDEADWVDWDHWQTVEEIQNFMNGLSEASTASTDMAEDEPGHPNAATQLRKHGLQVGD